MTSWMLTDKRPFERRNARQTYDSFIPPRSIVGRWSTIHCKRCTVRLDARGRRAESLQIVPGGQAKNRNCGRDAKGLRKQGGLAAEAKADRAAIDLVGEHR